MQLATEYVALLLIIILMFFFYEKETVAMNWVPLYRWCLFFPIFSISTCIICVTINESDVVPYWIQMSLNSVYFILSAMSCSTIAMFLVQKITEHVYDKQCIKRVTRTIWGCLLLFTAGIAANWFTGWIFTIDEQGGYHRGSWNRAVYILMAIDIAIVIGCYLKNYFSVDKMIAYALKLIIGLAAFLTIMQVCFPDVLLNGIMMAYVNVIMFVNFQSQKMGYDMITGIGNRKRFQNEITLRLKSEQQFQIVLVSPSDLSIINKKYGLKCGDELLYRIAHELEHSGPDVSVFRFSNVGFAVCFPYWTQEQVERNLEHVQNVMNRKWLINDVNLELEFYTAELIRRHERWSTTEIEDFLDEMIRYVKTEKLKLIRFDSAVETRVCHRNDMRRLLRKSIQEKSFQIWYQPIYDMEKNTFSSAEALIRMNDENGRIIMPGEFIPLAEELGVIEKISWIVLEKVCQFLQKHPELSIDTVSINISMHQLLDKDFSDKVEALLNKYSVDKSRIRLEMTERMTLDDEQYVQNTMRNVTEKGLAFFLDDFGTGYSNFISALQLPYECIKLDKSLMDGIEDSDRNYRIIETITEVFHEMGCRVIAEGIETKRQAQLMEKMKIDRIQGFYYARPMTDQQILSLISV